MSSNNKSGQSGETIGEKITNMYEGAKEAIMGKKEEAADSANHTYENMNDRYQEAKHDA